MYLIDWILIGIALVFGILALLANSERFLNWLERRMPEAYRDEHAEMKKGAKKKF